MLRAIREIQPRWVVGENVLGLVNWSDGLVFHEVQADLEAEGYEVQPYVLPAASVGAPHVRQRVWFVAYSKSSYNRGEFGNLAEKDGQENRGWDDHNNSKSSHIGNEGDVANTNKVRFSTKMENGKLGRQQRFTISNQRNAWDSFPTVSPVRSGNDGIPDRLDSITFPKWRNESIKAGGNAVVPQVVYQIFKTIEQYENLNAWTSQ
jgi:DNA (cytosine-5)-methyltransferase 1